MSKNKGALTPELADQIDAFIDSRLRHLSPALAQQASELSSNERRQLHASLAKTQEDVERLKQQLAHFQAQLRESTAPISELQSSLHVTNGRVSSIEKRTDGLETSLRKMAEDAVQQQEEDNRKRLEQNKLKLSALASSNAIEVYFFQEGDPKVETVSAFVSANNNNESNSKYFRFVELESKTDPKLPISPEGKCLVYVFYVSGARWVDELRKSPLTSLLSKFEHFILLVMCEDNSLKISVDDESLVKLYKRKPQFAGILVVQAVRPVDSGLPMRILGATPQDQWTYADEARHNKKVVELITSNLSYLYSQHLQELKDRIKEAEDSMMPPKVVGRPWWGYLPFFQSKS